MKHYIVVFLREFLKQNNATLLMYQTVHDEPEVIKLEINSFEQSIETKLTLDHRVQLIFIRRGHEVMKMTVLSEIWN